MNQTHAVTSFFLWPPTFEPLFDELSPANLLRLSRTCQVARSAWLQYTRRRFNINRRLAQFFPSKSGAVDFRSLQARTGTLISGSFALQFLDRTFYPGSDLDLYTHKESAKEVGLWLISQNYTYIPNSVQDEDFPYAAFDAPSLGQPSLQVREPDVELDNEHNIHYDIPGVSQIFTFIRSPDAVIPEKRKVQIIRAINTPIECILGFHSTCVMNAITYAHAYSFYPRGTFEARHSLALKLRPREVPALRKYAQRGFRIVQDIFPVQERLNNPTFPLGLRWVDDNESWTLPLDMHNVTPPPPLAPGASPLDSDLILNNSWRLELNPKPSSPYEWPPEKLSLKYNLITSRIFRYRYIVGDDRFFEELVSFCKKQGMVEYFKAGHILGVDPMELDYWTWWDTELSVFRQVFYQGKALGTYEPIEVGSIPTWRLPAGTVYIPVPLRPAQL